MPRSALRTGAEILSVLLVLASLGGTFAAIVAMYRRQAPPPRSPVVVAAPAPAPPPPTPKPKPRPASRLQPPPEDPTPKVLAALAEQEADERHKAAEAAARLAGLEQDKAKTEQLITTWRDRAQDVRTQLGQLSEGIDRIENDLDQVARQRDVLARVRDDAKLEVKLAGSKDSLAVLPYKGPNGTWRRPIPIECSHDTAIIQPAGLSFSLLDLALGVRMRPSPLGLAVAKYLEHAGQQAAPDGGPAVPYILFLVRPDGIQAYYECRATLETLGIAFGYELVGQDEALDFPDLDDPGEWTDQPSWKFARRASSLPSRSQARAGDDPADFVWPTQPPAWAATSGSGGFGTGNSATPGWPADYADLDLPGTEPGMGTGGGGHQTADSKQPGEGRAHQSSGISHPSSAVPDLEPLPPELLTALDGDTPGSGLGALPGRDASGWPAQTFGGGQGTKPGGGGSNTPPSAVGGAQAGGDSTPSRPGGRGGAPIANDLIPGSVGDRMLNGGTGSWGGGGGGSRSLYPALPPGAAGGLASSARSGSGSIPGGTTGTPSSGPPGGAGNAGSGSDHADGGAGTAGGLASSAFGSSGSALGGAEGGGHAGGGSPGSGSSSGSGSNAPAGSGPPSPGGFSGKCGQRGGSSGGLGLSLPDIGSSTKGAKTGPGISAAWCSVPSETWIWSSSASRPAF